MRRYESILDTIGHTPLVRIRRLAPTGPTAIWAKLEGSNPMGSVKERIALAMVDAAERDKSLVPGKRILESSSGNTGIGLAMIGAARGWPVTIVISAKASAERKQILELLGAEVIVTPQELGSDGAWDEADRLHRERPDLYCRIHQYRSPENVRAHYERTAAEIWEQTEGQVDAFVATLGTTGTLVGAGRRLHELDGRIHVVAVEPQPRHNQEGLRNLDTQRLPEIWDPGVMDEKIVAPDGPAHDLARRLAREEGIFAGVSSGSALYGAIEVARRGRYRCLVVIFPDRGEKYLSTSVYRTGPDR